MVLIRCSIFYECSSAAHSISEAPFQVFSTPLLTLRKVPQNLEPAHVRTLTARSRSQRLGAMVLAQIESWAWKRSHSFEREYDVANGHVTSWPAGALEVGSVTFVPFQRCTAMEHRRC